MDAAGLFDGLLDLVLPRRCVVCRTPGGWLCETCADDLRPLPERRCPRCAAPRWPSGGRYGDGPPGGREWRAARPSAARVAREAVACPECRERRLSFVAASAAFCYEGPARALVTACKFRALRSLVDDMARRAAPAFAAACGGGPSGALTRATATGDSPGTSVDLIVTSVPAHRDHRLERGFDPAELLARRLAAAAGLTYAPLLRRARHGARQSGLARGARAANVYRAFALREGEYGVGNNLKRVVIVDDVYTTGETLNQCAEALAAASFEPHVFTFARTVRVAHVSASRGQAVRRSDVHENPDQGPQCYRHDRTAGLRQREDRARPQASSAAPD